MSNETDNIALELVAPSALQAIERASIDSQVATAHAYPRQLENFRKRSLAMATLDVETAESCIYCRPVGKEKDKTGRWVDKFAEGPSIRMAEIVACCYGNLRVASRIVEQSPRQVKAEGVCHDLETNYAGKSDIVESTVNKEGQPYSERQQALIAKVAVAKAYRDAIFRVVPRALIKPPYEAAKKVVSGEGKSISDRVARVRKWLEQRRIDEKRALAVLGITDWIQTTEDQLMILTGLKTAVQDGDPIDEIFPPVETRSGPEPTPHQQSQTATMPTPAATTTTAATTTAPATQAANPTPTPAQTAAAEAPKRRGRPPKEAANPLPEKVSDKFTPAEAAEMRANGLAVAPEAVAGEPAQPSTTTAPATPAEPEGQPAEAPDAELAALGLAPEPAPEAPNRPAFAPIPGEAPELTDLRRRMYEDNVTEETMMKFCTINKLSMGETKLVDFVTNGRKAKLVQIVKVWKQILPRLK